MLGWNMRRLVQVVVLPLAVALLVGAAAVSAGSVGPIRIKPGDSLWEIAQRYGTTVAALKRLNHLPGDLIYAGGTLLVPDRHQPASRVVVRAVRCRVHRGDTVGEIAVRYRTSVSRIVRRNHLDHRATIRVGQVLIVGMRVDHRHRRHVASPVPRHYPASVAAAAARHRRILARRPVPSRIAVRMLIRDTARGVGLEPALALAVAQQESGFQQNVVSPADAIGVMQVLPSTGRWLGRYVVGRRLNLLNVHDNVLAGVVLLRLLTRAAPLRQAIAGYYQGLRSVRVNGMYRDTRRYVASVLALRRYWRR